MDNENLILLRNHLNNHSQYGLNFIRYCESCDSLLPDHFSVIENPKLKIKGSSEAAEHLLIEGENRLALEWLKKDWKNQINLIYIDPPYATGKNSEGAGDNFCYNDQFYRREDPDPHSRWLSFMESRLLVAKELLKEDGVIFISIGREESANLKLLCDSIFGEVNCLAQFVRRTKTTSFRGRYFAPRVDYLFAYGKAEGAVAPFKELPDFEKYNKIEVEGPNRGMHYKDDTAFYLSTLQPRPNQRYFIECPDGERVIPPGEGVWRWAEEQFLQKSHYLSFKKSKRSPLVNSEGKPAHWNLYTKSFYEEKLSDGNVPEELLLDFLNRNGSEEVKSYDLEFSYPKPSAFLRHLISFTTKDRNAVILDFFAGSGATGEAVMQLNALDGGHRKVILCNNNENGICRQITRERLVQAKIRKRYPDSVLYYTVIPNGSVNEK